MIVRRHQPAGDEVLAVEGNEARLLDELLGPPLGGHLFQHRPVPILQHRDDGFAIPTPAGLDILHEHRQEPLRSGGP